MDPVTAYATEVAGGRVVASRLVRQACARHIADVTHGSARGLVWKPAEAQRAIDFFAKVLVLPENTDAGEVVQDEASSEVRAFVLQPWQQFIVGSLFGWYTASGFRRFREAYIETAKGSGKTPLGAGIMLYLLIADGERGAQVFLAAVTREQAGLAWNDVKAIVAASPELNQFFGSSELLANELKVPGDTSFLKPVSSEKRGLDGKRVHGALVDELHEHATAIVVNKMRAGTKGRRNALIVKTTNSGYDRTSVCWAHHEQSRRVLSGAVINDAWFAFICGLDACDACDAKGLWFPDEECPSCDRWDIEGPHWLKANPNLGVSLPWQYVRERVTQARSMPSEVSDVLRFNFCVWTQQVTRAIDINQWTVSGLEPVPDESSLLGHPCYGALDLGQVDDFSCWLRLWDLGDGRVAVKPRFFIPAGAKAKYPNRPYAEWERAGVLEVTEGDVTDYRVIEQAIRSDAQRDGVRLFGYDKKFAEQLRQNLADEGLEGIDISQGFALNEACVKLSTLISTSAIVHGNHPVMNWMAGNYVELRGKGVYANQRRPAKERSAEKIDGIVALLMGLLVWIRQPVEQPFTGVVKNLAEYR